MGLKEAIIRVLKANGGELSAEDICFQIEKQNLFTKRDGTYPDPSYLLLRLKFYSDEFEFIVRLKD